jgi:hypothetical protein
MSGGGADGCRQGKGGQRRGGRLLVLDDLMLVIDICGEEPFVHWPQYMRCTG